MTKKHPKKAKSLQLAPKTKNIPDNIEMKQPAYGKKKVKKKKVLK
jgi:hypothetical protein